MDSLFFVLSFFLFFFPASLASIFVVSAFFCSICIFENTIYSSFMCHDQCALKVQFMGVERVTNDFESILINFLTLLSFGYGARIFYF